MWAKKSDKDSVQQWLPLKQHLIDVTDVIKLLWEHWLASIQRQQIINSLNIPNANVAKNLLGFLASVHDLGKATPVFQSKPSYVSSYDLDNALLEKLEGAGYKDINSFYNSLMSPSTTPHAYAGQILLESYGVDVDISSIVGAHHGMPANKDQASISLLDSYTSNYFQVQDSKNIVHRQWRDSQRTIFEWALEYNNFSSVCELPKIMQPGQVLTSGLLIMADWIASNENYFPLIPIDSFCVANPQKRKELGWQRWYKTGVRTDYRQWDVVSSYNAQFGFTPNDLQVKLYDLIQNTQEPGIYIIEAPMGVGKTEAALTGVEQLEVATESSGMFFGLPTQATSNGMFERIKKWLELIDEEKKSLQLVHGKSSLNDTYTSLSMANTYDESENNVIVNEWFTGRKTAVLDDFVVGTIDQFLMLALKQKHLSLRHLGFSKKVVVIDEVHAYDAYMNKYLLQALRWMGAYGVPVIILSATLPIKTRIELVENYMRGTGKKWRKIEKPINWEKNESYPLITYSDGKTIKQFDDIKPPKQTVVKIKLLADDLLIQTLDEQLENGGCVGIIVNTVRRAQKLAEECNKFFGDEAVEILHSSFIALDRVDKEKKLLKMIGKGANRPSKMIIIGTQVLEQSLDIDFDLLVSDLAPIDLLIQRIGRLHRHPQTKRPMKLTQPTVFVLGASETFDFEEGSAAVYGDYLLMLTQRNLPDEICLPADISNLVQKVYGIDERYAEKNLPSEFIKAKERHESRLLQKENKASAYCLDKPSFSSKKTLVGWLEGKIETDFEEKAFAQVRDIQDTIEVIALRAFDKGYTVYGQKEDLSLKIYDADVRKNISRHTIRLPRLLSNWREIDKSIKELEEYNKEFLFNWQELSWLKGMLGVIFNENDEFILNGLKLKYCQRRGLLYERLQNSKGDD